MKSAPTQHGVRNGDAGHLPQESQLPPRGSSPGSGEAPAHPSQATGGCDIFDNKGNIAQGSADAILRE